MGKYGKTAIKVTQMLLHGDEKDARRAWNKAVKQIFPDSESSQKKGCPRDACLGLCEEGLVKSVRKGNYTRSVLNKRYAVQAVSILRDEPELAADEELLWQRVMGGEEKTSNNQMDVVISLWKQGLIEQ